MACYVPSCFQKYGHKGACDPPLGPAVVSPPRVSSSSVVFDAARALVRCNGCRAAAGRELYPSTMRCTCTYCNLAAALAAYDSEPRQEPTFKPWPLIEREYFQEAHDYFKSNKSRMARELGINRRTLYRKLIKLGIHKET